MLSNTGIKGAKSNEKDYKIADEKGMYLFVKKSGSKYFRLDYRFNGKRKTLLKVEHKIKSWLKHEINF